MAYDEALAQTLRARLDGVVGIREKPMMGGLCFLLNGNMIGGVDQTPSGMGRYMFRVGKSNDVLARTLEGAEPMVQGGRRMTGLFFVSEDLCKDSLLEQWLSLALSNAASLPEK